MLRFLFHYVMTVDTPIGRKARSNLLSHGGPLVRVKPDDLAVEGIERVPRVEAIRERLPVVGQGRVWRILDNRTPKLPTWPM